MVMEIHDVASLVSRLQSTGTSIAQSKLAQYEDSFNGVQYSTLEEGLLAAFKTLDLNTDGYLDHSELRALCSAASPSVSLEQAEQCLEILDVDEDGKVSEEDWLSSLQDFMESLPLVDFHHVILAMTCASTHQVNLDADAEYKQPVNNGQFVMAMLGEQLQEGIAAVLTRMQDRHTTLASKQLWASDGYLPEQYVPPHRPIRMLGEWLRDNCPPIVAPEHSKSDGADWCQGIPWDFLTLDSKIRLVFEHLEEGKPGYVSVEAAQAYVTRLGFTTMEQAAEHTNRMDMGGAQDLDCEEFCEYLHMVLDTLDTAAQDAALQSTIWAFYLSQKDPENQFGELFAKLHADAVRTAEALAASNSNDGLDIAESDTAARQRGSLQLGTSDRDELGAAVVTTVDPTSAASEAAVDWAIVLELARRHSSTDAPAAWQKRLDGIPRSAGCPAQVTRGAFAHALAILFDGVAQKALADVLAPYVSGDAAADPAGHLQPEYQRHVKAQPLYAQVPWLRASELQALFAREEVSEVIGVDCRTEEEADVSTILSSLTCELLPNPSSEWGFDADQDALQEVVDAVQEAVNMPTVGRPVVVTLCTDGSRSCMVALQLLERFPAVRVCCLVGGLIAWFNEGHDLEDDNGTPVAALHPHTAELERFILRENEYT